MTGAPSDVFRCPYGCRTVVLEPSNPIECEDCHRVFRKVIGLGFRESPAETEAARSASGTLPVTPLRSPVSRL